jgi:hypothetical protein
MRGSTTMRGRRGVVWSARGRKRPLVSLIAPIRPRPLPLVVPTAQSADDLSHNREQQRGMAGLQSP